VTKLGARHDELAAYPEEHWFHADEYRSVTAASDRATAIDPRKED
jgi:hypothetical protein